MKSSRSTEFPGDFPIILSQLPWNIIASRSPVPTVSSPSLLPESSASTPRRWLRHFHAFNMIVNGSPSRIIALQTFIAEGNSCGTESPGNFSSLLSQTPTIKSLPDPTSSPYRAFCIPPYHHIVRGSIMHIINIFLKSLLTIIIARPNSMVNRISRNT